MIASDVSVPSLENYLLLQSSDMLYRSASSERMFPFTWLAPQKALCKGLVHAGRRTLLVQTDMSTYYSAQRGVLVT
jgi:hypothetical protein